MVTAGIDIGSVSTEMVVLKDGDIIGSFIIDTGSNSRKAAEQIIQKARIENGLSIENFDFIVTTGYGRKSAGFGDKHVTELSCHARGAWQIDHNVRTVIDIGGQDSKVIRVREDGKSLDFVMNDKCAAGTGRFLEVMAHALGVTLDDLGRIAINARGSVEISSMCTVFAESEVVSLIAEGHPRENIIRGLMNSIANRVVGMVHRVGLISPVMLTGGVAKNEGVHAVLKEKLNVDIYVPDEPQIVGALGAAHIAIEEKSSTT